MGVLLVLVAYANLHFGNSYCQERFVIWLSSIECSFLLLSSRSPQHHCNSVIPFLDDSFEHLPYKNCQHDDTKKHLRKRH